jgi:hypothetical protein
MNKCKIRGSAPAFVLLCISTSGLLAVFFLFLLVPIDISRKRLPLIGKGLGTGNNPSDIGVLAFATSSRICAALSVFVTACLLLFLTFYSGFFSCAFLSSRP